ncbi:MAG: hypothetical protein AMXMBFR34_14590 [Myxococcaceae bacterium]
MHRRQSGRWLVLVGVALAASACGPGEKPVLACDGEVSGAVAGQFTRCTSFDQLYRASLDTFILVAGYIERTSGLEYEVASNLELKGEPQAGRTQTGTCLVNVTSGGDTWVASTGMGATRGVCTVSFSEVLGFPQMGNTVNYCILKGRITARLEEEPLSAASMPVTLRLDFNYAPASMEPDQVAKVCGVTP